MPPPPRPPCTAPPPSSMHDASAVLHARRLRHPPCTSAPPRRPTSTPPPSSMRLRRPPCTAPPPSSNLDASAVLHAPPPSSMHGTSAVLHARRLRRPPCTTPPPPTSTSTPAPPQATSAVLPLSPPSIHRQWLCVATGCMRTTEGPAWRSPARTTACSPPTRDSPSDTASTPASTPRSKNLAAKHLLYQHQHNKQISCPAMAQLLSNTLYYKRFLPYYACNVLGGLDDEGKGCVFTYDAVGSYERVGYSAQGTGSTLIMPVLDNQLKSPSPLLLPARDAVTPLSESEAVDLVKDVFASATERDIYTGDKLEIVVINASGIRQESLELRKD